jgi:GAF domain
VNTERSNRFAVAFACEIARAPSPRLCAVAADVLAVSAAGITVMGGGQAGPVCVSSQRVAALEDLQFTMGEGPCRDAFRTGIPVHAPSFDLTISARWPSFVDVAQETGIAAVFAYPLMTKGARVGVLTLYQDGEGDLSAAQQDDSFAMAKILTETVLSMQDSAPAGELAAGLEAVVDYRAQVHQASGMVSVQLGVPVDEAVLRIRARSFASGRPIGLVASDIISRRLRFTEDGDEVGEVSSGAV